MTETVSEIEKSLATAPIEIKLAIDLIQLLEESEIGVNTAVKALEIVLKDFKNKQKLNQSK